MLLTLCEPALMYQHSWAVATVVLHNRVKLHHAAMRLCCFTLYVARDESPHSK